MLSARSATPIKRSARASTVTDGTLGVARTSAPEKVIWYPELNVGRPLSLVEPAGLRGASPWHITRLFQANVGLTPAKVSDFKPYDDRFDIRACTGRLEL